MYRILIACALVFSLAGMSSAARADPAYLDQLQQRALAQDMAASPVWRALLHYEPDWLGPGVTSTVASPWFFFAGQGKTDPPAELAATLEAFFSAAPVTPREQPARCAFPGRFAYLKGALAIDVGRLPEVNCPDYEGWLAGLDPESINLVFPASYPNSPSSMFGHTLLRINSSDGKRVTELLSYAVNFAASTSEDNGLMFAIKGLTGGYPGVYGLFPYYEKVKQYAWIENRDIWDYRVRLSDTEIQRLAAHLWAMLGVKFDYYFLTKNCSYQLLALLDVARPTMQLTERFDWYAIPADTIRALGDVPGLLGEAEYRPSLQTLVRWHAGQLTDSNRQLALAVAGGRLPLDSGELKALPQRAQARVLEVAHDYLYYQFQQGAVPRSTGVPRSREILLARSRLALSSEFAPVPVPDTPPDQGHKTLRVAAGGVWERDVFSLAFRIRPAYHDLLDDPAGYTDGAEINFLDLGLRLDPGDGELRVEDLTLINIVSLAPRGGLFKPVSWQIGTGFRRRPSPVVFTDAPNNLGYYVQGGPGLAWGDPDLMGYVFGLGSIDVNSALAPAYAAGAGGSAGVLAHLGTNWQLRAEAGLLHYVAGEDGYYRWARLTQQWGLGEQLGLRVGVGWVDTAVGDGAQVSVGLRAYY